MKKKPRAPTPNDVETQVLTASQRKCCLCYYLKGIQKHRKGQIAHLDRDRSNPDFDNLVWLCLDHHDEYDSRTSQSKGLMPEEVRTYRDRLYRELGAAPAPTAPQALAATKTQTAPPPPAKDELPSQRPERRLQYIVLADLVASTATTKKMGNDVGIYRMRQFENAVRQALNAVKPRPFGRVVKTIGDAVLLIFDHFPHILCWKLEFDGALEFKILPEGRYELRAQGMPPLEARVWIHVGEVEYSQGDIHGLAVSELCETEQAGKALVPPGATVVTRAVREVAGPTLYPRQCELTPVKGCGPRGGLEPLFTINIRADIAFMISQQRKGEPASA